MFNKNVLSIILVAVVAIFYGNTLHNDYALDDLIAITGNTFTQKGFAGIIDLLTHDAFVGTYGEALNLSGGRYRPFSMVMFAVEKEIFGYKPAVFHFFNILSFACTVVLIFWLLIRLLPKHSLLLPFTAALLFAIHPIHTEVVANIKSRDEIYALLFSLWAMYLILPKIITTKTNINSKKNQQKKISETTTVTHQTQNILSVNVWAPLLFFIALLSKEIAITFLALIPLALWLFANHNIKTIVQKTWLLFVVAFIYLALRSHYAGTVGDRVTTDIMDNSYLNATLMQKWATIASVQLRYLWLLIIPYPLSYDYSYNQIPLITWGNVCAIISLVLHVSMLVYAIVFIRKDKLISYCILFYFAGFALVSNLLFNIGTSMAERFAFMPSLAYCILLAYFIITLLKLDVFKSDTFTTKYLATIVLLSILAATQTIARNADWANNYTLYKADINKVPNSARAQLYYGIENIGPYQQTGDATYINTAINAITKATEINPKFHYAWHNLGVAYQTINKWPESVTCYQKVLQLQPHNEQAYYGLGLAYGKGLNQPQKAIPYFTMLVDSLKLTRSDYFEGLGLCYATQGLWQQALIQFKRGTMYNPTSGKLYYNIAITYANAGFTDSSNFYFDKAFALDPSLKR